MMIAAVLLISCLCILKSLNLPFYVNIYYKLHDDCCCVVNKLSVYLEIIKPGQYRFEIFGILFQGERKTLSSFALISSV